MRYIKHLTATRQDEKVAKLLASRNGYASYGLWWAILETIGASLENGSTKASLAYPISQWAKCLRVLPQNLLRHLEPLEAARLLRVEMKRASDEQGASSRQAVVELSVPNLLKYRDEWQRKLRSHSGVTPESLRSLGSGVTPESTRKKPARSFASASPTLKFSDQAIELFREHYGSKPSWTTPHYVQLTALLKRDRDLTVEEFSRRFKLYLQSPVPYHQQQGGSLQFFCSRFDAFVARPTVDLQRESKAEERERKTHEAMERFERSQQCINGNGDQSAGRTDRGPDTGLHGTAERYSVEDIAEGHHPNLPAHQRPAGNPADRERNSRIRGPGPDRGEP